MSKADNCIKKSKEWKGLNESTKFKQTQDKIIIPWRKKVKRPYVTCRNTKWCGIAMASLLMQCLVKGFSYSASCKTQRAYYKRNKRWLSNKIRPYKGLIIFVTGHEGIVEYTRADGTGVYWSGNCKNAYLPSKFNWKTGKAGNKKILGYGKPIYK